MNKNYTFTFTPEEMRLLMTGLGELQSKFSYSLITRLNQEILLAEQPGNTDELIHSEVEANGTNS
jgi:hypothetical protein